MTIECPDPECREDLHECIHKKLDKSVAWTMLIVFGLPLVAAGLIVWAKVTHSDDRYTTRTEMEQHARDLAVCKEFMRKVPEDLKDLKISIDQMRNELDRKQTENSQDIKEILRHLRDNK